MDEAGIRAKMSQILDLVRNDISSIRTGRVSPALVENIVVPAYGGTQRLRVQELGTISVSDPQTLVIEPWDKSIIGDIRKGILEANVGLNPNVDETKIRISLPPLTTEDREKYAKLLGTKLESGRVMVRQARGDAMHSVKQSFEKKEITEDEHFAKEKKIQEITDEYVAKIESIGQTKKEELMHL
ncbi:MAG: ribosome recycling factor [Patescibacteria group bacterium]